MTYDFKYRVLRWILDCKISERTLSYYESDYLKQIPDIDENTLEQYFHELSAKGIIDFNIYAEDGFEAEFYIGLKDITLLLQELDAIIQHYREEQQKLNDELQKCKNEYNSILTFNPHEMSDTLKTAIGDINKLKQTASTNDIFTPLLPTIEKMKNYIDEIETVNGAYSEVYKNIINPIKVESASGVKATVNWAIISIIVSTVISIILNFVTK